MIDLSAVIRSHLLTIPEFNSIISTYKNSKAAFTRRPVPSDAIYPICIISPIVGGGDSDYLACKIQTITHDVIIYGQNDTSQNYMNVEKVAFAVARSFHRLPPTELFIQGASLLSVTASNPFPAPTDDNDTVARAITINFEVKY